MIGVVTSGGESRRMGTDKGLMMVENKSWVQNACTKLSSLFDTVVISVNPSQIQHYSGQFDSGRLVPDADSIGVKGPLHGLLSVHLQFPADDLLVLACDMVSMETFVLKHLHQTAISHGGHDCYIFQNENGYQPLAGIYSASLLANLLKQSREGQIVKFSMKQVLDMAAPFLIPVPDGWEKYFVNYNFKEDIDFQ